MDYSVIETRVGVIRLFANAEALVGLACEQDQVPLSCRGLALTVVHSNPILDITKAQLASYLEGSLRVFDVPIKVMGTAFEVQVWQGLANIAFGECVSYAALAARLECPAATRAVAAAIGRNPVPIIVPCQRVISSQRRLTGFASGLDVKRVLLELEGFRVRRGPSPELDTVIS